MAGWVDGMVDLVTPGLAPDSITASHSVTTEMIASHSDTTEMIDFVSDTGFSGTSSCSPEHRTATTTVLSVCGPAGVGACGRSATEAGEQSDADRSDTWGRRVKLDRVIDETENWRARRLEGG